MNRAHAAGSSLAVLLAVAASNPRILGIPLELVGAGAGIGSFGGDAAALIGPGVAWDVRTELDLSDAVGLELNYLGGINPVTRGGANEAVTTELQTGAQLQPFELAGSLAPYLAAGLGVTHVGVSDPTRALRSDTSLSVPLAVGANLDVGDSFALGARGQLDLLPGSDLVAGAGGASRWSFLLNLGATRF
jgi:hypothetical protein